MKPSHVVFGIVPIATLLTLAIGYWLGTLHGGAGDGAERAGLEKRIRDLEAEREQARLDLAALGNPAPDKPRVSEVILEPTVLQGRPGPVSSLVPGAVPGEGPGGAGDVPVVRGGTRFRIRGLESALDEIDWAAVGGNTAKMGPLLVELHDSIATGKPMPPEAIGKIYTLNGPLVTAALEIESRMKTGSPNTAYTHPAFMTNAIAATLEAAKFPLSDGAANALSDLGVQFTEEETRRALSYDERTFALRKAIEEAALRDRFFDAAFAILTPEQRNALVDPRVRGRLQLDLFSSGLVWLTRTTSGPVTFRDLDGLVAALEQRFSTQLELGLTDTQREDLERLIRDWLKTWPAGALDEVADAASLAGMMRVPHVAASAGRELTLIERMGPALALDAKALDRLRALQVVYVPLRTK